MFGLTFRARALAIILLASLLTFSFALPNQVIAEDVGTPKEGVPKRRIGGGTRTAFRYPIDIQKQANLLDPT